MRLLRRSSRNFNVLELLRMIAFLILMEGGFMLVPLLTGIIYGESDAMAFGITIVLALVIGLGILTFVKPRNRYLGKRDGILLTALVWIVFSAFSIIPFMISSANLNFVDAFFESMSGFTTTGASVIPDIESLSNSIKIWRCMMQWIGGIGIVIFTVALLPMFNSSGGMQMYSAELSGITIDKLQPRINQTALRLCLIYIVLTLALCLLLWIGPMNLFDSICHAFSTVSTGGSSTRNASIGAWNSDYVRLIVILFMFLGGVSFVVMYRVSLGKTRQALRDENFRTYIGVIVVITLLITLVLIFSHGFIGFRQIVIDPLFQVVSLITSTGYTVSNLYSWNEDIFPLLMILMFSGACAGSTSGGAKIDRFIFLWKNSRNELHRIVHPNRYYPLTINGNVKSPEVIDRVTSFLWFYIGMVVLGGVLLSIFGMTVGDAFFSSFSCMGNIGVGIGSTLNTYATIPAAAKLTLSLLMLVGRLEIFTILILFSRSFWHK